MKSKRIEPFGMNVRSIKRGFTVEFETFDEGRKSIVVHVPFPAWWAEVFGEKHTVVKKLHAVKKVQLKRAA